MPTYPIGLLSNKIVENITITTDQTTLQTVGINLTFASGVLKVNWGDGSSVENFSSGVELTHDYVSTGTYDIKISGNLTEITKFIADNSRITSISDLKTGLLTDFNIINNLYSGALDMSNAPISQAFQVYSNSGLTSITFATSGNAQTTNFRVNNCNLSSLDLSNVPISGTFRAFSNPNLSTITFSATGNGLVNNWFTFGCNLSSIDLTNIPTSGNFWTYSNPNLSTITFATSGNSNFTDFKAYSCNLSSIDFSNSPVGGTIELQNNSSLSSITFSTTGNNTVSLFRAFSCNLSSLNFTNVPLSGAVAINNNSGLSSLTLAVSGNGVLTNWNSDSCTLSNIDFSVFATSDGVIILTLNNSMTATEVDNQLINLDGTGWINGTINIAGTNAARTSASDTAYNNLIANGWTITVN